MPVAAVELSYFSQTCYYLNTPHSNHYYCCHSHNFSSRNMLLDRIIRCVMNLAPLPPRSYSNTPRLCEIKVTYFKCPLPPQHKPDSYHQVLFLAGYLQTGVKPYSETLGAFFKHKEGIWIRHFCFWGSFIGKEARPSGICIRPNPDLGQIYRIYRLVYWQVYGWVYQWFGMSFWDCLIIKF